MGRHHHQEDVPRAVGGTDDLRAVQSTYLSSDTDEYEALVKLVHDTQIGGVIAFGGTEAIPQVMLNNTYGNVVLGQPLELASILNRLQSISALPLLDLV